ncbi:hypothetical protein F2P79_017551 [Pimephales promelas]|nr:hypothetical protein F2P79_017551 [Pimephales promelas]
MPLIRMRDANLPWHASGEVEGKREEFCSPFLSDTQTEERMLQETSVRISPT